MPRLAGYWPNLITHYLCALLYTGRNDLPISCMICLGWTIARRSAVTRRQIKLEPEGVMADVCLGVTVAGLYTLVGMGLIIAFM